MAEEQNKSTNHNNDLEEIDELPDIVLGEKTRAMRVIHDGQAPDQSAKTLENSVAGKDQSAPNPSPSSNDDSGILRKLTDAMKEEHQASSAQPETQETSADQVNEENTEKILDAYHNDNEDDDEIPTSVIDDDPGIRNDLDEALKPRRNRHDETDPLPPVQNELSKVYSDDALKHAKHAVHDHETASQSTSPAFEKTGTSVSGHTPSDKQDAAGTADLAKPETPPKKKKKHQTPLNQRIVSIILIILLVLLAIGLYRIYESLQPAAAESSPVSFEVKDGENIRQVADSLAEEGIIRDSDAGYYYARLHHLTDVKRGVFELDQSWSLNKLFTTLNDDQAANQDAAVVTLTEGDWAKDMADKIAASTNVKADDLMALWNSDDYIRKTLMPKYSFLTNDIFNENIKCDLEGYLAPDTYTFNKETTAEEVTAKILDQTNQIYTDFADQISSSGYTVHQIYTLASIVQGESSREDQMKKIAGVFYNRLKQDMPLQSSVTTCYIIDFDKGKTDWQECEASYNTAKDDPYNTYKNKGLPPGPVQNPGKAAINAVLNPEQSDYLFFMADVCGNTGIHYAKTSAEQDANVKKYNTCS